VDSGRRERRPAGRSLPGLDIDSLNEHIVAKVKELAWEVLGPAPVRIGKAPKTLLMYRTDEPVRRMRSRSKARRETHLIEMLGDGQQYLIHGIHATTLRPYVWPLEPPNASELTPVTPRESNTLFPRDQGPL